MATNYIWNIQPWDNTVCEGVRALASKGRKEGKGTSKEVEMSNLERVRVDHKILPEYKSSKITKDDKLTIVGHGTTDAPAGVGSWLSIGGKLPKQLADMVRKNGFISIKKIVVFACGEKEGLAVREFARFLGEMGYNGEVVGYTAPVSLYVDNAERRALKEEIVPGVEMWGPAKEKRFVIRVPEETKSH